MEFSNYSYGVNEQFQSNDPLDEKILELKINGYTTLESGLTEQELIALKFELDNQYEKQANELGGHDQLVAWGDANILRTALATHVDFLRVATNANLMQLAERFLGREFVLVMQNGLINKPGHGNAQGKFHRDLNYQHWTSSRPIAFNALLCLDDFTFENGATWVTPGSHHVEPLPTKSFLDKYSIQITALAGTFLVLDGMLFHKAGSNTTTKERRALNHVLGLPFMAQTVNLPAAMKKNHIEMPEDQRIQRYLGLQWNPSSSPKEWRESRFVK